MLIFCSANTSFVVPENVFGLFWRDSSGKVVFCLLMDAYVLAEKMVSTLRNFNLPIFDDNYRWHLHH